MHDPEAVSATEWQARMDLRVAAQAARVAVEMATLGIKFIPRGRPRSVTRQDGVTYPSVSDAARENLVNKVDNICQAIRRGGKCAGWHWAYTGEEPAHFGKTAGMAVAASIMAPDFNCCWPRYKRIGNVPPQPNRPLNSAA